MTGFDHTDWTHTNFAPYEPDTDGTEVQVEPLILDVDPTFTMGTDDSGQLSSLYVAEDGVETVAP
jgi:hypothetical protein